MPDGPFPRINETKAFGDRMADIEKRAMVRVMLTKVLPVVGAIAAVVAGYYWMDGGYSFLSSFGE